MDSSLFCKSRRFPIALRFLVCCAVIGFFSGCAARGSKYVTERTSGFNVEVYREGKPVADSNSRLVHYYRVPEQVLQIVEQSPSGELNIPFQFQKMRDNRGGVSGLKVLRRQTPQRLPKLGLRPDDIIQAVGSKHVLSSRDMWEIVILLRTSSSAAVSLKRKGEPHKILYYLDS